MLMDDRQERRRWCDERFGNGPPASRRDRRLRIRRTGCGEGLGARRRRCHRHRPDESPPGSTAAASVATGILSEGDIALPIRDVLRRQRNTRVVLGEVVDIDLDARRVAVDTSGLRREIEYDILIVATGARQSYFGRPEFAAISTGSLSLDVALGVGGLPRGRVIEVFVGQDDARST